MKNINFFKLVLFLIIFNLFITNSAFAYLDPGNGSMLIQIILASIFGFLCTIRLWFSKLLNIFKINKNKDEDEE